MPAASAWDQLVWSTLRLPAGPLAGTREDVFVLPLGSTGRQGWGVPISLDGTNVRLADANGTTAMMPFRPHAIAFDSNSPELPRITWHMSWTFVVMNAEVTFPSSVRTFPTPRPKRPYDFVTSDDPSAIPAGACFKVRLDFGLAAPTLTTDTDLRVILYGGRT